MLNGGFFHFLDKFKLLHTTNSSGLQTSEFFPELSQPTDTRHTAGGGVGGGIVLLSGIRRALSRRLIGFWSMNNAKHQMRRSAPQIVCTDPPPACRAKHHRFRKHVRILLLFQLAPTSTPCHGDGTGVSFSMDTLLNIRNRRGNIPRYRWDSVLHQVGRIYRHTVDFHVFCTRTMFFRSVSKLVPMSNWENCTAFSVVYRHIYGYFVQLPDDAVSESDSSTREKQTCRLVSQHTLELHLHGKQFTEPLCVKNDSYSVRQRSAECNIFLS